MNKTIQINLGGVSLTIDDDAYRRLDLYMHELEQHFAQSASRDEIIADIEARLAELLTEVLRGRSIVTLQDVAYAVKVMGSPSDFDDEPMTDQTHSGPSRKRSAEGPWDIRTGKRLFRDPEDKVIGGVCSGLAAFLGIEDPLWVRAAFVVIFFTAGFGLLAYIIAWALIPEAKTAGDRLAMEGHPANVKNIANMIDRGLDDLSETIKDKWGDFKKKSDGEDRHFMRRSNPLGNDVLVLDKPSVPTKIYNTIRQEIRKRKHENDDFV